MPPKPKQKPSSFSPLYEMAFVSSPPRALYSSPHHVQPGRGHKRRVPPSPSASTSARQELGILNSAWSGVERSARAVMQDDDAAEGVCQSNRI